MTYPEASGIARFSIVLVVVLLAGLLLAVAPAWGCSCASWEGWQPEPPAFAGEVVWVDASEEGPTAFLLVEEAWGTEIENSAVLQTYFGGGPSCGVHFSKGERWLVYKELGSAEPLLITSCGNSGPLEARQADREALGPPTAKRTISPEERAAFVEEIHDTLARSRPQCAEAGTRIQTLRVPLEGTAGLPLGWSTEDGQELLNAHLVSPGALLQKKAGAAPGSRRMLILLGNGGSSCWVEACFEARADGRPLQFSGGWGFEVGDDPSRACVLLKESRRGARLGLRDIPAEVPSGMIELSVELRAVAVLPFRDP